MQIFESVRLVIFLEWLRHCFLANEGFWKKDPFFSHYYRTLMGYAERVLRMQSNKDEPLQLDLRISSSQVAKNHLREDTRNRTGILCMKIKKCFWWSDHQDPMNLYPRMTCTGAMPLITQPQNYTREKMVHCLNRYIMSCFFYGCVG